eukprot:Trichotokara_eunicae@DN9582_c0_g1_i1.p1
MKGLDKQQQPMLSRELSVPRLGREAATVRSLLVAGQTASAQWFLGTWGGDTKIAGSLIEKIVLIAAFQLTSFVQLDLAGTAVRLLSNSGVSVTKYLTYLATYCLDRNIRSWATSHLGHLGVLQPHQLWLSGILMGEKKKKKKKKKKVLCVD